MVASIKLPNVFLRRANAGPIAHTFGRPPTGCPLTTTTMPSAVSAILADPAYHDYLAILKGARNGFVYGVKVRFPHALIMAILFGRGTYVQSNQIISEMDS